MYNVVLRRLVLTDKLNVVGVYARVHSKSRASGRRTDTLGLMAIELSP